LTQLCTGRLPKNENYCSALPQLSSSGAPGTYTLPDPASFWSGSDLVTGLLGGASISSLFPIDGNDTLGNCTVAGVAHGITCQNGPVGKKVIPAAQDVINLYHSLGGRGMSGLQLTTVLSAWRRGILGGHTIAADVNIDPGDKKAVRQSIQYLNGTYIGFNTNGRTVYDFQNGLRWTDDGREDGGGHAVWVLDFDDRTGLFRILTWGGIIEADQAWWDRYVDEVHGVVSEETAQFEGLPIDQLKAAMAAM
jgi:hypothetical protein